MQLDGGVAGYRLLVKKQVAGYRYLFADCTKHKTQSVLAVNLQPATSNVCFNAHK